MTLPTRSRLDCSPTQSDVSVHLPGRRAVMRNVSDNAREQLSAEIAGLESLDLNQLRARWKLLYEIEAPPHLSRDWLGRAFASRIQENVPGVLKPAPRRLLDRVTDGCPSAQADQGRADEESRTEY